jgi:hypothetical protein
MLHRIIPIALLSVAAPVRAQLCTGGPGFDRRPAHLHTGASSGDHVRSIAAGIQLGRPAAVFGAVSAGMSRYRYVVDDYVYYVVDHAGNTRQDSILGFSATASSRTAEAVLGYQLPLGRSPRAQLCPVLGASFEAGPNGPVSSLTNRTSRGATLGVSAGAELPLAARVSLVPWGAGKIVRWYSRGTVEVFEPVPPADIGLRRITLTADDTFGEVMLGWSLLLDGRLSIAPAVTIPVGLGDARSVFSIAVTLGVGGRGRSRPH